MAELKQVKLNAEIVIKTRPVNVDEHIDSRESHMHAEKYSPLEFESAPNAVFFRSDMYLQVHSSWQLSGIDPIAGVSSGRTTI